MFPHLVALTEGPNIFLDKPILLFGRDLECDIRFDSRKISRKHCCLAQVGDCLVVRDLGSTNGIRINGVRVTEGHLRESDEFTIGNHRYQVRWDQPANGPPVVIRGVDVSDLGHQEPTIKPASPSEDDLLESSDSPIPLAERPDTPRLKPNDKMNNLNSQQNQGNKDHRSGFARLPPKEGDSAIISENASLSPPSDIY